MTEFNLAVDICPHSTIGPNTECFRGSRVVRSTLAGNNVVGDFSRVYDSILQEKVRIDRNSLIYHSHVGRLTYTGMNTVVMHAQIGQFCAISWGVTVGPGEHDYHRVTSHDFLYNPTYQLTENTTAAPYDRYSRPCILGNDVWLGANVTVLRGCTIGDGAVIGANATVTSDIPPYAIAVGSPARVIRYRFDADTVCRLQALRWWDLPLDTIAKHIAVFQSDDIQQVITTLEQL